jgi:hypothetical protein
MSGALPVADGAANSLCDPRANMPAADAERAKKSLRECILIG